MGQQGAQVIVIDGFLAEIKGGIHGVERTLANVVHTSMEIRGSRDMMYVRVAGQEGK